MEEMNWTGSNMATNDVQELERKLQEAKARESMTSLLDVETIMKGLKEVFDGQYVYHGNGSSYGNAYVTKIEECVITETPQALNRSHATITMQVLCGDRYSISNIQGTGYSLTMEKAGIRLASTQLVFYARTQEGSAAVVSSPKVVENPQAHRPESRISVFGLNYAANQQYYTLSQFKNQVTNQMSQLWIIKQEVYDLIKDQAIRHSKENLELWEAMKSVTKRAVATKDLTQSILARV